MNRKLNISLFFEISNSRTKKHFTSGFFPQKRRAGESAIKINEPLREFFLYFRLCLFIVFSQKPNRLSGAKNLPKPARHNSFLSDFFDLGRGT
jgi:hypothetical protein